MANCDLLCCICKQVVIGTKHNVFSSTPMVDPVSACEACGVLYHKFRVALDGRKAKDAQLAVDLLTLRGAVAQHLHAKITTDWPEEAAKLASMTDLHEAIRSAS